MTNNPTAPSAEAIEAAAVAMEDAALTLLGRDLGTVHRNAIAQAAITAALPLLSVPEAGEVAFLHERVETALIERAEFEAEAERLREALRCGADLYRVLAARTPDDDAEGKS